MERTRCHCWIRGVQLAVSVGLVSQRCQELLQIKRHKNGTRRVTKFPDDRLSGWHF